MDNGPVNQDALDGNPGENEGATGSTQPRPKRNLAKDVDVIGARVEGMAVMLRDMARVALAAAVLACVALILSIYLLRRVRGAQAA